MNKKDARERIKNQLREGNKKRGPRKKERSTKDWKLYDKLTDSEQNKFWCSETGKLKFKEMTGEHYYPQFIIDRAFDLYIDGLSSAEIAIKWQINIDTVERWCTEQNWVKKVERLHKTIESKFEKDKVNTVLTERQEIDKRHLNIVRGMQGEISRTINESFEWETDPVKKARLLQAQLERMKVLKIATDCYSVLISKEREIVGIKEIEVEHELPTDFTFIVKTGNKEIDDGDLELILPSQDPHNFDASGKELEDQRASLSNNTIEAGKPVVINVNAEEIKQNIDPITIARDNGLQRHQQMQPEKKPHPAFGWIDIGGGSGF